MPMGSDPQAVRPWSSNGWAIAVLVLLFCQMLLPATAGVLYTERELWAVGNLWEQTRAEWHSEIARYDGRVAEIEASAMPQKHKEFLLRKDASYHRAESQRLAGKRDQVQQVLIHESNARAARSGHATREQIKATLGTPVTDPGHRGIRGDLDAGGGEITARHMQDVLKEMGLGHLPVRDSPGTLDIGGEFELCIHKGGLAPAAGSEYHHIRNNVDARNHEVYMSERMRNRVAGTKQAGTDFVEVQDHLKKASDGLFSSNAELVQHADRMQIMAKGTNKTLQMGDISDQELAAILQQHGVTDTPEQFRRRMAGIKEQRVVISDPAEAGKLRDVSRDVFATAESKTYTRAQTELDAKLAEANRVHEQIRRVEAMSDRPETRARRDALKKSLQTRERLIREEIVDSRSKVMATANANAETRARATRGTAPETTRARPVDPGARVAGPETAATERLWTGASRAYAAFSLATDIVDVVNTVRAFEDYMNGDAPLSQVVRNALNVPPLSPIGTMLGTSERIGASAVDYLRASADLREANEQNLEAYLTQWEIRFRRAGMSATEARSAVADAVLAGDLDALEARAQALRLAGREIESPVLVVEEGIGPDGGAWYMWENAKDMGYGMAYGIADATHYLANIPVRMATAWDHSDLEYDDTVAETEAQTRLFRALLNAGIDREQALIAVQVGGATLHRTAQQARENLDAARQEQARLEDERRRLEERIDSVLARIDILRWMYLNLRTDPVSPVTLPRDTPDGFVVEVELALTGDFNQTINGIRHDLGRLTGQKPGIDAVYRISLPGAVEVEPGVWRAQLPAVPDSYPVTVEAEVMLAGFGEEYAGLQRTVHRTVVDAVLIRAAQESIVLEHDSYAFRDGDYERIQAIVEGADPDVTYYYFWSFGDRTAMTETPEWWFHAVLDERVRAQVGKITVALANLATGGLLDEARAFVRIEPRDGPQGVWVLTEVERRDGPALAAREGASLTANSATVPVSSGKRYSRERDPASNRMVSVASERWGAITLRWQAPPASIACGGAVQFSYSASVRETGSAGPDPPQFGSWGTGSVRYSAWGPSGPEGKGPGNPVFFPRHQLPFAEASIDAGQAGNRTEELKIPSRLKMTIGNHVSERELRTGDEFTIAVHVSASNTVTYITWRYSYFQDASRAPAPAAP